MSAHKQRSAHPLQGSTQINIENLVVHPQEKKQIIPNIHMDNPHFRRGYQRALNSVEHEKTSFSDEQIVGILYDFYKEGSFEDGDMDTLYSVIGSWTGLIIAKCF